MTRPWMAFDVETSGTLPEYALQPWRVKQKKAWITTVAFTVRDEHGAAVSKGKVYPTRDDLRGILQYAIDSGTRIVTWNGTFDMAWLHAYKLGDLVDKALWLDAMRLWKHLDISSSFATADHNYALKGERGAAGVFLPHRVGREEDVDYHDPDPAVLKRLLSYNKDDTEDTLEVAEIIWDKLDTKRRAVALTEAGCYSMIAAANLEGMQVNRKAVVKLNGKMNTIVEEMRAALEPHGVTETVIRSPKQLSAVMFDQWGLPDPSGKKSTAKDFLTELVVVDDRAALLMQFREALGLQSKFIGAIVKSCEYNEDRVTRPQANIFGTYTSRLTYNSTQGKKGTKAERYVGFALHQMKRAKDWRSLIVAPEGHAIVEFDAAGQEFRWMAILSEDATMLELCLDGEDPHAYMAAQIYGDDYRWVQDQAKAGEAVAKKHRQGGKVANLSLQYRTSGKTLRVRARTDHGLVLSANEANRIYMTYQRTYKGVPLYWQKQIAKGRKLGYAETIPGRRVQVRGNWAGPMQWAMESTMINYPVQGTGGEQKYLALKCMKSGLLPKYDARFAWDLHDGIYFYVPVDKAMAFAVEGRQLLGTLPYKRAWNFDPPIPMPWDAKVGPSWGELVEVEG